MTSENSPETRVDLLPAFLEGRDVACPGCRYNLRDLHGSRCPECGDELKLQVGLTEPKLAAFIFGLIGLAAGAGFSGLLLGYFLIRTVFLADQGPDTALFLVLTVSGLIIEGVAILAWIRAWPRVRRRTPARKWLLVAVCWVLSLANLFFFSLFIK